MESKIFFFLIVDVKEETTSNTSDNNKKITDIKAKVEQETKEKEFKHSSNSYVSSNVLPVSSREINKKNTNIKKKSQNAKGKRKKKEDSFTIINEKVKPEEQEDCVDVETIPRDEVPGI